MQPDMCPKNVECRSRGKLCELDYRIKTRPPLCERCHLPGETRRTLQRQYTYTNVLFFGSRFPRIRAFILVDFWK